MKRGKDIGLLRRFGFNKSIPIRHPNAQVLLVNNTNKGKGEFTFIKNGKKIRQIYGATIMEDYFLGVVTTDNYEDIEPEIWTTLESIRFKEVTKRNGQRTSRQ